MRGYGQNLILVVALCFVFPPAAFSEEEKKPDSHGGSDGHGQNCFAGLNVDTIQEFRTLDSDHDNALTRDEFFFSTISQQAVQSGGTERSDTIFALIDTDRSQTVSMMELAKSPHNRIVLILDVTTAKKFHSYDKNADGLISRAEFEGYENKSPEEVAAAFDRMDLNQSSRLGPMEFLHGQPGREKEGMDPRIALKFASRDANEDGGISREEYAKSGFAKAIGQRGDHEKVAEMFNRIDYNGNDEIDPNEYAKFQKSFHCKGIEKMSLKFFTELDLNKDGAISLREYSKSRFAKSINDSNKIESLFQRIDQNGDGELNLTEYANRFKAGGFYRRKGYSRDKVEEPE